MSENIFDNVFLTDFNAIEKKINDLKKSNNVTIKDLKKIYDCGVRFYTNFQFKEAEIIFSAYCMLNAYDHRGPASLAAIYLELLKFDKAFEMLNIVKTYPTCDIDETMLNLSLCCYKLHDMEMACVHLLIVKKDKLSAFYSERYDFLVNQLNPYLN